MKLFKNTLIKSGFFLLFVLSGVTLYGQDARLNFDNLNKLEDRAADVVEVTIDGKLLETAKRAMSKVNDADARKIGQAISGLRGIYVRVYNFEKDNEYNVADVDQIRSQLRSSAWTNLANVRSKKNNQKIDVFTMFTGDLMSGVAVVLSEAKSIAVVNVVGAIDIDALVELSGKMNIPKIEIERSDDVKNPTKNN